MRVCAALLLGLVSVGVHGQSTQSALTLRSGIEFKGDSFDGLTTGPKITPVGKRYVGLVQSKPNASPPPKELATVVNGLVAAYLNHHPERYASYALPGAILFIHDADGTPQDFIPRGFPFQFTGELTANTPYYLPATESHLEGTLSSFQRVRVEWLVDGQLAFVTWLTVFDGKVIEIIMDAANPPRLPRWAFDPPEAIPSQ